MIGRALLLLGLLTLVSISGGCSAIAGRPNWNAWRSYQPLPRSNDVHVELALDRLDRFQPVVTRRAAITKIANLLAGGNPRAYRPSMVIPHISEEVRARAAEKLTVAVEDPDAQVRRRACFALGVLGAPHATAALQALARATADPDLLVARQAAFALGRLGVDDAAVVQALTDQLVPPTPQLRKTLLELHGPAKTKALRFYAAVSLFAVLSKGKARLPITGKLATEGTGQEGSGASEPLGQLAPALAHGLRHHADWRARRAAAQALGELGDKRSYVTLESLRQATQDPDRRVRAAAKEAQLKILRGSNAEREF